MLIHQVDLTSSIWAEQFDFINEISFHTYQPFDSLILCWWLYTSGLTDELMMEINDKDRGCRKPVISSQKSDQDDLLNFLFQSVWKKIHKKCICQSLNKWANKILNNQINKPLKQAKKHRMISEKFIYWKDSCHRYP